MQKSLLEIVHRSLVAPNSRLDIAEGDQECIGGELQLSGKYFTHGMATQSVLSRSLCMRKTSQPVCNTLHFVHLRLFWGKCTPCNVLQFHISQQKHHNLTCYNPSHRIASNVACLFHSSTCLLVAAASTIQHVSGNTGVALRATEEIDTMLRHTGASALALKSKLPC